jgi:hypothetical protein
VIAKNHTSLRQSPLPAAPLAVTSAASAATDKGPQRHGRCPGPEDHHSHADRTQSGGFAFATPAWGQRSVPPDLPVPSVGPPPAPRQDTQGNDAGSPTEDDVSKRPSEKFTPLPKATCPSGISIEFSEDFIFGVEIASDQCKHYPGRVMTTFCKSIQNDNCRHAAQEGHAVGFRR